MQELSKQPPQSLDLEKALLGSILLDNDCLLTISMGPSDFYYEINGKIFKEMKELYKKGMTIDLITLGKEFENEIEYIAECSAGEMTSSGFETYAHKVKEYSDLRKIIKMAQHVEASAYLEKPPLEILEVNKKKIENIAVDSDGNEILDNSELNNSVVEDYAIKVDIKESGGIIGYDTGYSFLKFGAKELVTLVAHSGNGKSILAQNIAANIALKSKVIFFSFEMSKEEIMYRIYSMLSGIPLSKFTHLLVTPQELGNCADLFAEKCGNLKIYDRTITVDKIYQVCQKEKLKNGLDFIVIDYVQITADKEDLVPKTQKVTRVAKEIAQNLDIGVLQLSQFNREGSRKVDYSKDNKFPTSHDILGGESVKQNSNQVYILHNETLASDSATRIDPVYVLRRVKGRNFSDCKSDCYLNRTQDCMRFTTTNLAPYWL